MLPVYDYSTTAFLLIPPSLNDRRAPGSRATLVLVHWLFSTMRGFSCSLCALGLGLGLFGARVSAAEFKRRDGVHRLEKAHVTAVAELGRRATVCSTGYAACPASLGGGCCQSGYECATDSCYATTSAPRTCAGQVGYFACDPVMGGKSIHSGLCRGLRGLTLSPRWLLSRRIPM